MFNDIKKPQNPNTARWQNQFLCGMNCLISIALSANHFSLYWWDFYFGSMTETVLYHLRSFPGSEVWRTWSRTHHPWRSVFPTSSSKGCWSTWTLPRSSSLISVRVWRSKDRCFTLLQNSFLILTFSAANPEAMASSGKTDKSPHDQEIKFFAKVWGDN